MHIIIVLIVFKIRLTRLVLIVFKILIFGAHNFTVMCTIIHIHGSFGSSSKHTLDVSMLGFCRSHLASARKPPTSAFLDDLHTAFR